MRTQRTLWLTLGLILVLGLVGLAWWSPWNSAPNAPRSGRVISVTTELVQLASDPAPIEVYVGPATQIRILNPTAGFAPLSLERIAVGDYLVVTQEGSQPDEPVAQIDVFPSFPVEAGS